MHSLSNKNTRNLMNKQQFKVVFIYYKNFKTYFNSFEYWICMITAQIRKSLSNTGDHRYDVVEILKMAKWKTFKRPNYSLYKCFLNSELPFYTSFCYKLNLPNSLITHYASIYLMTKNFPRDLVLSTIKFSPRSQNKLKEDAVQTFNKLW